MAMPLARHFTVEEVLALPDDGKRYEVIHGELLVTPAPGGFHQPMLMRLLLTLAPYLQAHGLEQMLTAPADITYSDDTLVQPDLFVADTAAFMRSGKWTDVKTLFLAIEIISPSSVKTDRTIKRRLYQAQRIPEYWVVDLGQRQIEVWTPDAAIPRIERKRLSWRHPSLIEECEVDLTGLFNIGR